MEKQTTSEGKSCIGCLAFIGIIAVVVYMVITGGNG